MQSRRLRQLRGGSGYCSVHASEQRKQNRSRFNSFYASAAWRYARRRQLFDHPLCQYKIDNGSDCGLIADSVHHIVELEDGGAARDPANLMSVCRPHHSLIHAQRKGGGWPDAPPRAASPLGGAAQKRLLFLRDTGRAMSQENVEILRAAWEMAADETQDGDALRAFFAAEAEWHVTGVLCGRGRTSGAVVDLRFPTVVTLRGGKIVRAENYADMQRALKAVGLSE